MKVIFYDYLQTRDMSDDERDLDLDSDEDGSGTGGGFSNLPHGQDKRAHHNALERKRRDHIKDSFTGLKDAIPTLQGDKSSRAQILKKASEYIAFMRRKNGSHSNDIEDLKRQNNHLENQVGFFLKIHYKYLKETPKTNLLPCKLFLYNRSDVWST